MAATGASRWPPFPGEGPVIFVAVGTQLPFDRLVRAGDSWAGAGEAPIESFAQIGDGSYQPRHLEWAPYLPEAAFPAKATAPSLIVSHARIGNLRLGRPFRKPIVLM